MKKLFTLALVIFLVPFLLQAQDASSKRSAGDKALLFSLSGLGNLGAGNYMGGVGFKYYFSNNLALRAGLGFANSSETKKAPTSAGADEKTTDMAFSIAPGIVYELARTGAVVGYVGGQIMYTMSSNTVENPNHVKDTKTEVTGSTFGAGVFMGAEWYPWNNVSLSAEYLLGFSSTTGKNKTTIGSTTTETDAPSSTVIGLGSANSASFTLSFYW